MTTAIPAGLERRREDFGLITGTSGYVDDLKAPQGRPAPLHMVAVRSPYAHAEIKSVNLEAARAMPGVVAAFSGAELAGPMPLLDTIPLPGLRKPPRHPLATDRARYVGDPVAVILAESSYAAIDALEQVEIDYIPLTAVSNPETALAPGAPVLYDELGDNVAFVHPSGGGDIQAAFQQADRVVRLRVVNQRIAPASLEARACLFDYDPASGQFTAWLSSQRIYGAQEQLAATFGLDKAKVRVYNAQVGGGFGAKTRFMGEELAAAALALKYGRPVKWAETRSENLQAQSQGRGQTSYIEAAVKNDGRWLGLRVRTVADLGAFLAAATTIVPTGTARMLNGPYRLEAIDSQVIGSLNNKVPTSAYRGAGRPEAAYILERTIDKIARELNLDPAEVRLRNFIPPEAFPYSALTGIKYDSGDYAKALQVALEVGAYKGWRARQETARASGSSKLLGIGLSTYIEISGDGGGPPGMPTEAATVRIRPDGKVLVQSGVAHNGQGHFTAFAQLAAQVFNLPGDRIEVEMNDSALPAYGIGTFGSRTLQVAGSAVHVAAEAAREKALRVAAQILEAAPADLTLEEGRVQVRGVPARSIELGELARLVETRPELLEPDSTNPNQAATGLAARRNFSPEGPTFPSGAHLSVVEVDSATGEIKILDYLAVDDCGRVLNHYLADAQVHGSLAQGLGQALYEEIVYDENGQLLSGTLMDYTIPTAEQLPVFKTESVETPSPRNPLGVKGIGESGCTGGPPCLVNAVLDALAPLGIKEVDMPLRPEKIWALIEAAKAGSLSQPEPALPPFFRGTATPKAEKPGAFHFE